MFANTNSSWFKLVGLFRSNLTLLDAGKRLQLLKKNCDKEGYLNFIYDFSWQISHFCWQWLLVVL